MLQNTTNEIRGRTDCCEDFAGQTVKKIQFLKIVVVLLSNYLKCMKVSMDVSHAIILASTIIEPPTV